MNTKTFVSYSWTSPEHEDWVLKLATELREVGVDVILDKWDLKEGHDAIAFMEKIVTDPEIKKVILVCDQKYAEKTDSRAGGVGTEAQIISPAIYAKADQNKFVAVVTEIGPDGKPFVPTYYRGRIHIDLSSDDIYAQNFEQLVRWVNDKPVFSKPALGKSPSYLVDTDGPSLANAALHRRAVDAIRNAKPNAKGAIDEYFDSCIVGLEAFRISGGATDFDDAVVKSIEDFLPYRTQIVEVLTALAGYRNTAETQQQVHRFFEHLLRFHDVVDTSKQSYDWDADNLKFLVHELFLYLIAILLKRDAIDFLAVILSRPYYTPRNRYRGSDVVSFTEFFQYLKSMEHRKSRLKLKAMSVHAQLLEERSHASGMVFDELMQADFVLFIRSSLDSLRGQQTQWWPDTLLYCNAYGPFEVFARAQSRDYFARLGPALGFGAAGDLTTLLEAIESRKIPLPNLGFRGFPVTRWMGAEKIATVP